MWQAVVPRMGMAATRPIHQSQRINAIVTGGSYGQGEGLATCTIGCALERCEWKRTGAPWAQIWRPWMAMAQEGARTILALEGRSNPVKLWAGG